MPTGSTIALFLLAATALAIVPGPAVAYIVTQSIDKGRRAGHRLGARRQSGARACRGGARVGSALMPPRRRSPW